MTINNEQRAKILNILNQEKYNFIESRADNENTSNAIYEIDLGKYPIYFNLSNMILSIDRLKNSYKTNEAIDHYSKSIDSLPNITSNMINYSMNILESNIQNKIISP